MATSPAAPHALDMTVSLFHHVVNPEKAVVITMQKTFITSMPILAVAQFTHPQNAWNNNGWINIYEFPKNAIIPLTADSKASINRLSSTSLQPDREQTLGGKKIS